MIEQISNIFATKLLFLILLIHFVFFNSLYIHRDLNIVNDFSICGTSFSEESVQGWKVTSHV